MTDNNTDASVLNRMQELASEEHRLYNQDSLSEDDDQKLRAIQTQLDQWDLLRQRQALRDAGKDPAKARVRPPKIVENYEQ